MLGVFIMRQLTLLRLVAKVYLHFTLSMSESEAHNLVSLSSTKSGANMVSGRGNWCGILIVKSSGQGDYILCSTDDNDMHNDKSPFL